MLNSYKLIAYFVGAAILVSVGWLLHSWKADADTLHDQKIATIVAEKSAEAIAKITVTNTTIRQTLERETREKLVYTECRHTPDGLQWLNAAITGAAAGELPAPSSSK